jgi:hypothetical protein
MVRSPQTYGKLRWKTILITGANTSLSFDAPVQYTGLGAEKIIIAVRDAEKGNSARLKIESGTRAKNVEV